MNEPDDIETIDAMQQRLLKRHQTIKQLLDEKGQLLDALLKTQLEHSQMLKEHIQRLDSLKHVFDDGFRMVDDPIRKIEFECSKIHAQIAHITGLLTE